MGQEQSTLDAGAAEIAEPQRGAAQRRRVLQLRDDLGWSSLDAEYEAEKRWVPIFLH